MVPKMISILLITYNHACYIRKALDSILFQNYSGPIELVIGDDCSTDDTVKIIKEYDGKDARIKFKFLDCPNNLGTTKNYQRGFNSCTGEYIAILEGDDYWVSPNKLARQIAFLDEHYECSMVSHNYFIYEEERNQFHLRVPEIINFRYIGARDLIYDNIIGNFSTCMYRRSELMRLPEKLYNIKSYDWIINILLGTESLLGFIYEPMSVYRVHSSGVWSQSTINEKNRQILEVIPLYDELTNHVYNNEFSAVVHRIEATMIVNTVTQSLPKSFFLKFLRLLNAFTPPIIKKVLVLLIPPKITEFIRKRVA